MGDEGALKAAQEGPEAYERYIAETKLEENPGRQLVHAYDLQAPCPSGDSNEFVVYHGAIDGNAMARINTSVTPDKDNPGSLKFDEDGVNTMMLPLVSDWEHEETKEKITGESLMVIVASIPHVLHHFEEHGLDRVPFMLNYGGEDHVESHANSYLGA